MGKTYRKEEYNERRVGEKKEQVFLHFWGRAKDFGGRERERSLPLPQIMLPSFPHLGKSQGSAQPKCNGKASPWRNCLDDHSVPWAR